MDLNEFSRQEDIRHEVEAATPSLGLAGLIFGAFLVIAFAAMFFGSPPDRTSIASRDTVEAPAPTMPQNP